MLRALAEAGPFAVRVVPKASADKWAVETGTDGRAVVKVWVTAVPEDGKANKAVVALLAKALGVAKSRVEIMRGETGRDKLVRMTD